MKNDIQSKFIRQNKKLKNRVTFMFLLLSLSVFAQTALPTEVAPDTIDTSDKKRIPSMFIITFGPLGILNTQQNSAPSPILFSIGGGAQIKLAKNISLVPHGHFFGSYYLWHDGQVLPAEIEHRTAYVPSILLDIPVTYDIYLANSIFRVGAGISFLFRFAALANNVPESEAPNIQAMNKWFWQNGRFLHPSIHLSWDYIFDNGMAVGLGAKGYLSLGGLLDDNKLNNSMITLSVRFIPPTTKK